MNSPNQSIYSMTHSGSIYKLSEKSNGRKPTRFRRKISFFGKFINGTFPFKDMLSPVLFFLFLAFLISQTKDENLRSDNVWSARFPSIVDGPRPT